MILKNCRLIPELCEGFESDFADIRVEGTDIAEILPAGGTYTGEEVIDLNGKTVMPGLHNDHIHLWFTKFDNEFNKNTNTEYGTTMLSLRYMYKLLAYGYTSLREVGGPFGVSINLKNQINQGLIVGPRLKTSGLILTPDQYCPAQLNTHSDKYGRAISGAQKAAEISRKTLVEGADYIKILGSPVQTGGARGDGPILYPDELEAIYNVAKNEGTYVAVHTTTPESNQVAIDMETASIEHGLCLSQENIDSIVAHGNKSAIVVTLSACAPFGGMDAVKFMNWRMKDCQDAGILLGFGTDAWYDFFMADPAAEFTMREGIGFSKMDILKQATINSAIINRDDANVGTIKVGKKADFAIFDGKPDEDLTVFGKPCALVLRDGKVVAREGMVIA